MRVSALLLVMPTPQQHLLVTPLTALHTHRHSHDAPPDPSPNSHDGPPHSSTLPTVRVRKLQGGDCYPAKSRYALLLLFRSSHLLFLRTRVISSQMPISSLTFHRMFSSLLRTLFVFVCRVADFFVRFIRFLLCLLEVRRRANLRQDINALPSKCGSRTLQHRNMRLDLAITNYIPL